MLRRLCPFGLVIFLTATGCTTKKGDSPAAEQAVIPVAKPAHREVTDFVEFTGRTNAVESVNVVPRVTGYLTSIPFKEGAEVKAGDLLFEVDPRPYKAQLDQAEAQVALYQAQLNLAKTTLARDRAAGTGVSRQQIDQDEAAVSEAEARVKAFQASTEVYKQNLDFTKVKSPIAGQVGRHYLTPGNIVNQDQTLVTTVVSLDPIHVYFDMDELTKTNIDRAVNSGRIKTPKDGKLPVNMELPGETNYPRKGYIDFVNSQVNPNTGSIAVRGVFDNPKPKLKDKDGNVLKDEDGKDKEGVRMMAPGMFVRIQLPIGQKHPALLVVDRAITSDQGNKYVYVVDSQGKVEMRKVALGALQEDGLRVITEGLKGDESVVVGGLPQVRPGMIVKTDPQAEMPSYAQPRAEKEAEAKAPKKK